MLIFIRLHGISRISQETGRFAVSITTALKKCEVTSEDWQNIERRLTDKLTHGKSMQTSDNLINAQLEEEVGLINSEILTQRDVAQGGLKGILEKYDEGRWRLAVWGQRT